MQTSAELRKVRAVTEWLGGTKTRQRVRDFSFIVDEPEELGGRDAGPTPLEYVMGAFNGCLLVVIECVAREQQFHYEDVVISSYGTVDRRGLFGTADVSPHFQEVVSDLQFASSESEERLQLLQEEVTKRCPMYNLYADAGIRVHLNWTIKALHDESGDHRE